MERYEVLIALRSLHRAKSRLGIPKRLRSALALAMALDTASAALISDRIRSVRVVCADPLVTRAMQPLGVECLTGEPGTGLNDALTYGLAQSRGSRPAPVALMTADLPAVTPQCLTTALERCAGRLSYVPDAAGSGTVLLAVPPSCNVLPHFGQNSAASHEAAGAVPVIAPDLSPLRRDVDVLADLIDAERLGVGLHTRRALEVIHHEMRETDWNVDFAQDSLVVVAPGVAGG